jgi:hypothetical protein
MGEVHIVRGHTPILGVAAHSDKLTDRFIGGCHFDIQYAAATAETRRTRPVRPRVAGTADAT